MKLQVVSTSNESGMKLQIVSNINLANNQAASWFRAQTSQEWNYKLILILNNRKWSYKLISTSNDSRMKLQVVFNFNLANNEAASHFWAQTCQEWNYKLILILNNRKWSYKLFSTSNESGMKLQVASNFNLANNKATSCFRAQTSQEWNYKLILILNNRNEATSCFQHQTSLEWSYKLFPTSN